MTGVDDLRAPHTTAPVQPVTNAGVDTVSPPPAGKLSAVFRDPLDIEAAHLLVRDLVDVIDTAGARRLLAVTYRRGRKIAFTLGAWYVLSFTRRRYGIEAGFCFDYTQFPEIERLAPHHVGAFSARYAQGRDIRWAVLPWNHLNQPPDAFLLSWRSTVALAARAFKGWQAAQVAGAHDQALFDALLDEDLISGILRGAGRDAAVYTLDDHLAPLPSGTRTLYTQLRRRILDLSPAVSEQPRKPYVAYKTSTNFVDIIAQQKALLLTLNMPFSAINDPQGLCRDVSDIGHWGNGDVEVTIDSLAQMEDVMALIRQSFERHS